MGNNDRYVLIGLLGGGLLLTFYMAVASLLGGFSFAIGNFVELWYWMAPLVAGFGVQTGMFFYIKEEMHKKSTAQAAASTGVSATSMVACCAHHIADIAPFLGITALSLSLTKYQSTFLLAGIFSNVLGIAYMASLMNAKISKSKIKAVFYSLLVFSIIAVFASYYFISKNDNANGINQDTGQSIFPIMTSDKNSVEFQVTPLSASDFQIAINTHSVDLDFDLAEISTLYDDLGNSYKPLKWEGPEPGGHHMSGILKFPSINNYAKSIKLVITDTTRREFNWDIK